MGVRRLGVGGPSADDGRGGFRPRGCVYPFLSRSANDWVDGYGGAR
jgi:hypothetical protein